MKILRSSSLVRATLLVSSLLLTGIAARAVTISASLNVTNINPFTSGGPFPFTDDGVPLGTLDFTGQPVGSMPALQSMNFSLALGGLDTGASNFDFNNITLTIAGINTGGSGRAQCRPGLQVDGAARRPAPARSLKLPLVSRAHAQAAAGQKVTAARADQPAVLARCAVMIVTATTMTAAALTVRAEIGSPWISQPSHTATTGLTHA